MKQFLRSLIALVALLLAAAPAVQAQIVTIDKENEFNADSIRRDFDSRPYFGMYKDNYFLLGTTFPGKPTSTNSDVKFQISIRQRLTKSRLPWNTYLFLFYTQKAMWNVFQNSMPFHDLNYNPGIGLSRLIIIKDKLVGSATLMIEHESNGRDRLASRSWNKISLAANVFVDPLLMVHGKFWIPIVDGGYNRDILRYSGIYQAGLQARTHDSKWVFDATLVKRKGWNLNFNTIINVGVRFNKRDNQYLMLQYYNGYGECLLDYNKFHSRLRIGLLMRPEFFSDF